jgi:A/G-specific adenine glycosylase
MGALAADEFVEALDLWASTPRRNLPWRETRDPWAVLVSETMSQQTQLQRVIPRYREFLKRFPDPLSCAIAPVGDVLCAWAGLGYNRRAVQLHAASMTVVRDHGGALPASLAELRRLPGVGPYTARAVLAFAFEQDVAVLDTNVGRVLARWSGRALGAREAQAQADALVPTARGWWWNQALLDFGALVCRKRSPLCQSCPVRAGCGWQGHGPDPAVGSAAVSAPQSRFVGSDRQGRGRLVAALRNAPVTHGDLAASIGWPEDAPRAQRVAAGVVADGLASVDERGYRLPSVETSVTDPRRPSNPL